MREWTDPQLAESWEECEGNASEMWLKCDDRGEILPNGNLSDIRTEFGLNQLIPTKCSSVEIFGYAQCYLPRFNIGPSIDTIQHSLISKSFFFLSYIWHLVQHLVAFLLELCPGLHLTTLTQIQNTNLWFLCPGFPEPPTHDGNCTEQLNDGLSALWMAHPQDPHMFR